jgi:serine/threonine protein kinase
MSTRRKSTFTNKNGDTKAAKIIGDYSLTSTILGAGQFGEVVLAKMQDAKLSKLDSSKQITHQWMACKIIKKQNLNQRFQQNLKNEIGILSRIQHPNVIGLFDIQKTINNFYLFMQYCNGGDL